MSYVDKINMVYHKKLEKFGISFLSVKHLLKSVQYKQTYFFKPDYRFPVKDEKENNEQRLFVSFQALIEKDPSPIIVADISELETPKLTTLMSSNYSYDLNEHAIPTSYNTDFGVIFSNYQCLCTHLSGPLADFIDDSYNFPDISKDQVAFMSSQSMFYRSKSPIQVIPKNDVSIYHIEKNTECITVTDLSLITNTTMNHSSVFKSSKKSGTHHPNSVSFKNTIINERTPGVVHSNTFGSNTVSTLVCDTGITTVDTSSSSSYLEDNGFTTCFKENSKPVDLDLEEVHNTNVTSVANEMYNIPGPSNMKQYLMKNTNMNGYIRETRGQGHNKSSKDIELTTKANQFYKDKWGLMSKDEPGWKCVYVKTGRCILTGGTIEVYVIPSLRNSINFNLNKLNAIENLEYFHTKEALYVHITENSSLLDSWDELWLKLYQAGWREVGEMKSSCENVKTYLPSYYELYFTDKYININSEENKVIPGLHKFVSRQALRKYVSRFPFLLQSENQFLQTLKRFNWEINLKNKVKWEYDPVFESELWDFQFNVPTKKESDWISLEKLKERLWMCPVFLFKNLKPRHSNELLLSVISLDQSEALALDQGPFSPYVDGLSRDERDEVISSLDKTFPKYMKNISRRIDDISQEEISIKESLLRLNWENGPAYFLTSSWKKRETVWISPWLKNFGGDTKKITIGRDYFWSLQSIYKFVTNHSSYAYVEQPKSYKNIDVEFITKEELELTNRRLRYIANSSKESVDQIKWPIEEMLQSTGWKVIGVCNQFIYIPHWSLLNNLTEINYNDFKLNEDYFQNQIDVLDHLAGYGNNPTDISETLSEQTTSPNQSIVVQNEFYDPQETSENLASLISSEIKLSQSELVSHLGESYEIDSHEGYIIQLLKQEKPYFSLIYTRLREIGWYSAYDPIGKYKVICTPWALLDNPLAFTDMKKKSVNVNYLACNLDYFTDDDEGKKELLNHLKNVGFSKFRICSSSKQGGSSALKSTNRTIEHLGERNGYKRVPTVAGENVITTNSEINVNKTNTTNYTETMTSEVKSTHNSIMTSSSKLVTHLGKSYEIDSHEGYIIQLLKQEKPIFSSIYTRLKKIGWYSAYDPIGKYKVIYTPWALLDNPLAFTDMKKSSMNVNYLACNLDYFLEDDKGKENLLNHLKNVGFSKFRICSSSKQGGSSALKSTNRTIEHLGVTYDEASAEAKVIQNLRTNRNFPTVYSYLKYLGWAAHYDEVLKATLICTPWSVDVPNAFSYGIKTNRYKLVNSAVLLRYVDYFVDDKDGKEALLIYIERNGFKKVPTFEDEYIAEHKMQKANSLTINKRSPAKACHRATEPDQMVDRHISDHPSPEINSLRKGWGQITEQQDYCSDVNMYNSVLDILESDSPNKSQDEDESDTESEFMSLLRCEKPNFSRVFSFLAGLEKPWTYEYLTDKSTLPNNESAVGLKVIYLRPDCKVNGSKKLIKHEDYFLNPEHLLDYLKFHYGFIKEPFYVSDAKKNKTLRSGRQLPTNSVEHFDKRKETLLYTKQEKVITTNEVSNDYRKRSVEVSKEENNDLNKKSKIVDINFSKEVPCLSITEKIEKAKLNLIAASSSQALCHTDDDNFSIPTERTIQHNQIFDIISDALKNATSTLLYVCGSPGLGKTLTVMKVLNKIASLRCQFLDQKEVKSPLIVFTKWLKKLAFQNNETCKLGYNVTVLNGTQLTKQQDAYITIAENLGLFNNDSELRCNALSLLSNLFSSSGKPVKFSNNMDEDENNNKHTVPMTVLVIDEFDVVHKEVANFLLRNSFSNENSSLIIIGIGNNISLPDTFFNITMSKQIRNIVFPHYSGDELISILQRNTLDLFHKNASILLANKVLKNHKGDVRCLLTFAEQCLRKAEDEFNLDASKSLLDVPYLVEVKHVKQVCDKKDRTVELIESLPPKCQLVLVALLMFCEDHPNENAFTLAAISKQLNLYLFRKVLDEEGLHLVRSYVEQLVDYSMLKITKPNNNIDKVIYRLQISSKVMLQAKISEMYLSDLRRHILCVEKNREACLT